MPGKKRNYIILGFIAIVLVYTLYYMLFVYVSYFNDIPRKVRHISRLISIIIVYGIGYYAFKKYDVKWLSSVWNFIYFVVVVMLLLVGIYDWTLGPASASIRNVAKTMHELLISPILYAALLIINRIVARVSPQS
ncbi:MAG: hypothetical protein ACTHMI_21785 [Mucilaginibacter sp.]|uniref:hypothetical protein n=1 Tax=Mucilaginibacter sp. L3T2-6 TaxID=3062491 RepID=UPI0026768AD2|nr:hypothetical protein [Mucilaginibacter sp. L3T2-6]MDO3644228.1 hypothetical protein [Mucilaginibacter sp. L3T2-6]MDV6216675.1 hypothetical protein [Mucilaginibacter sp. L3T2-6]